MTEHNKNIDQPVISWRFKGGIALFIFSIIIPLVGIPLVASLNMSATAVTAISGVLLVGAEVLGILAVAVMGKDGYVYVKQRIFKFLKPFAPSRTVERIRYNIGIFLFFVPLLFGWISIYVADYIPYFLDYPKAYAIGGDLLFLISLFVLGGDFWDKVRALFVYSDKVCSTVSENVSEKTGA